MIVFYVRLGYGYLRNVLVNIMMKYGIVFLNKGEGYNFNIGIFIVLEDGVYLFVWFFLIFYGGMVYIVVVVDNVDKIYICIKN